METDGVFEVKQGVLVPIVKTGVIPLTIGFVQSKINSSETSGLFRSPPSLLLDSGTKSPSFPVGGGQMWTAPSVPVFVHVAQSVSLKLEPKNGTTGPQSLNIAKLMI